jgi:predicted permease
VKKVLTNPIIVGALTALVVMALNIRVPDTIEQVISSLSDATTPMALILLGAQFSMKSVSSKKKDLAVVVIARLVVVPAIGLSLALALGIRGVEFVSLLVMLAAPAAVSSFTMAESMGSDGKLAGNIVVFTTALSCLTIFLWLFIFKNIGAF